VGLGEVELSSELIGCLPIVQHFLARWGRRCLERHLPDNDARLRLAPAWSSGLSSATSSCRIAPSTRSASGLLPMFPACSAPERDALALNDDRVGRMLDRLSTPTGDARHRDGAVGDPQLAVDVSQLHNDSTTVTFTGSYTSATAVPARQGDPGDPPWSQQGLPARPQAIAVHPHRLGRRGRADRLPGDGREHLRRSHPHPDLGRARPSRRRPTSSIG